MKTLEKFIFAAGLAAIAYLIWEFNPSAVCAEIGKVGFLGFALILLLQAADQGLSTIGWIFALPPKEAAAIPFSVIFKARVAGDGVNYLTPSGTIAGELIRPGMLGDEAPLKTRNASVLLAKLTQAAALALLILIGVFIILPGRIKALSIPWRPVGAGVGVLTILFVSIVLYWLANPGDSLEQDGGWRHMRLELRRYLSLYPGRFVLSTAFFTASYAWGAIEGWIICRFMNLPVSLTTALAIEILSNFIDAVLFMVPGKAGTQEGGKTLIFWALGFTGKDGLSFGLIRHARELVWAGLGFAWFTAYRRAQGKLPEVVRPGKPRPLEEPL